MILRPLLCTPPFGCSLEYDGVSETGRPNVRQFHARCQRHAGFSDLLAVAMILAETRLEQDLNALVLAVAPAFELRQSARWMDLEGTLTLHLTGVLTPEQIDAIRARITRHPQAHRLAVL